MQVRVTTDNNIEGSDNLLSHVEEVMADVLSRFSQRITRVEVFLADENSRSKSGQDDKRCTVEARLAGRSPVAVTEQGGTLDQVIRGAAEKLEKALGRALGRADDRKGRRSMGGEPGE